MKITGHHLNQIATSTQQNAPKKVEKEEKLTRVEELKKAIESGNYKVDVNKTAEVMAKALL
jgi:anti-sigma28 factor (negative regulator of flagellin synthesis)